MEILDGVDIIRENTCFITLKDHKQNFWNILTVRLINPAKNKLVRISDLAEIYLLKGNTRNTRPRYEICSKLIIKTPEQRQWRCLCTNLNINQWKNIASLIDDSKEQSKRHYVKSVQIWSYFWSVFSCIRIEYGDSRSKSPYSIPIQENTDQK